MLETKFKVAFLFAVLFFTSLPVIGILRGTTKPPQEPLPQSSQDELSGESVGDSPGQQAPITEEVMHIPAGHFVLGTKAGGYDEQPQRRIFLDAYAVDRYEVTNHQYQEFVDATGQRKPGPPSRYAKNMARMRGVNQPVVYVSWGDADAYCRWKGKRLPTEAEWEKAMRGVDGRLWPWGNNHDILASNWSHPNDGFDVTAPVGSFRLDVSPFGVADGAGNVMEWVADWYDENTYREASEKNPKGPDHGVYKVLRGGVYTTTGIDVRITSRSKMVPDFRDETIGFRCAIPAAEGGDNNPANKRSNLKENQSNRG